MKYNKKRGGKLMLKNKFYTVADVASITGLTQRTIRNYIKDNTLHGQKIGVQWRFTEEDIKRLFKETDESLKLFSLESNPASDFILDTSKDEPCSCMILDFPDLEDVQIKKMNQTIKQLKREQTDNKDIIKKIDIEYAVIKDEGFYRVVCKGRMAEVLQVVELLKGSIR